MCLRSVLYAMHTHTHTQARLHTSCPLVFSEVQPEVLPASQSVLMMVAPSKSQQLLRDLAPRQKWNTGPAERFPNTRMIHTCSVRVPRMQLCVLHSAEVSALANVVSVDYSSFRWGNVHCTLCACVCVDGPDSNGLFCLSLFFFFFLKCC